MNRNDSSTGTTISAAGSFRSRPNKITPAPRINSINENAAAATLEGGELEATFLPLGKSVEISPHASYLHASYDQYPTAFGAISAGTNTPFDYANKQGANATAGFTKTLWNGADLKGGGVAGVHFTRHPIQLAHAVMDQTPYVLMVGPGADAFSRQQGLEQQPPSFFFTEMRWREFEDVMRSKHQPIPPRPAGVPPAPPPPQAASIQPSHFFPHQFGTVGAVARDGSGHDVGVHDQARSAAHARPVRDRARLQGHLRANTNRGGRAEDDDR